MKAVIYTKTGGLEVVKQQSVQVPIPGDNQVLVEVKAYALNIGDYQRFQTKNGKIPVSTHITNKLMYLNWRTQYIGSSSPCAPREQIQL